MFHADKILSGCPAVISDVPNDDTPTTYEGFYLASGVELAAVDMYVESRFCPSTLHAAKLNCDATLDCLGFQRIAASGCVVWITKDSSLSNYTFHQNMDIEGVGLSTRLTGPHRADDAAAAGGTSVWGSTYDGVYLVRDCDLTQVSDYVQYYPSDGTGSMCTVSSTPLSSSTPHAAATTAAASAPVYNNATATRNSQTGGRLLDVTTSPVDLYKLRRGCEAKDSCIGFRMQSTGCVYWILGKDVSTCVASSRRIPDALWTPPAITSVVTEEASNDTALVTARDVAVVATTDSDSDTKIDVIASLVYASPTLSVSLRGEFYYGTCDAYQARLIGKIAFMPASASSESDSSAAVTIVTVGATMGCPNEDGSKEYNLYGSVSDFVVVSGVVITTAVANVTITSYANGTIALNGTFDGTATVASKVEGFEGFDMSDSSATVSVTFAKLPNSQLKVIAAKLFVNLDVKYYHSKISAATTSSLGHMQVHDEAVPGSVQRYRRSFTALGENEVDVEEIIPPTGVPNVHVWGKANFTYPCFKGDRQRFSAHVSLRFDPFHLPGLLATATYFCQQTGATLPAFTFTSSVSSGMTLGPSIHVSALNILINGYNLGNGTSGYSGYISGAVDVDLSASDSSAMDLTAFFNFNTMAGTYGLQARLVYDSTFVRAEIKTALNYTSECDSTPQVVTGQFVWTTPSSSEAIALLKGEQRCMVEDEEMDPVMTISGSMREFVFEPVPGCLLVINSLEMDLYGFIDTSVGTSTNSSNFSNDNRTAWSFRDLAFRLEMSGTISLHGDTSGIPKMSSALDSSSGVYVTVTGSLVYEWTATSSELKEVLIVADVSFTQGDEDSPTVAMAGSAAFVWPCANGAAIAFFATVDINMGGFVVNSAVANASIACGTPIAGSPVATALLAIDAVIIDTVTLSDVFIQADVYSDERGTGMVGSIEGYMEIETATAGDASSSSLGATAGLSASFQFDTFTSAMRGTVELSYESEYLILDLRVAVGTGKYCDMVNGNQLSGSAVLDVAGVSAEVRPL